MTLSDIYNEFQRGSHGFVQAVQTHCGFNCSDEEIENLAKISETADEFEYNWENTPGWTIDPR